MATSSESRAAMEQFNDHAEELWQRYQELKEVRHFWQIMTPQAK
jgi:hypothetical protein